ncbi:hypothetical protein QBC41DRAFT_147099 [Cercophora samala]|uniref:Uncharacterized protein n=1 Tax=Cercophora samala TaxID=330535 RepID=A0AA39Z9E6_9PEZI|nr:hypothetical protein QBC41DRAFT_147099 [Cercophora samala]
MLWCPGPCQGGACACRHTPPRPHVGGSFHSGTEMSNSNGNCDPAVNNPGKNDRPTGVILEGAIFGWVLACHEVPASTSVYLSTYSSPDLPPATGDRNSFTHVWTLLISRQRIKIIDTRPRPRHLGGIRKIVALVGPCCASVLDAGAGQLQQSFDTGHGRVLMNVRSSLSQQPAAVTEEDDTYSGPRPWANRHLLSATRLHGALLGALPSVRFQLSATALVHCYPV